jgi:hypothetical protein
MIDPFVYLQFIRKVILALPGTTEGLSHGTPGFYVQKKMLARLWESGEVLVIHNDERELWMEKDPEVFFITDHYRNYPYMLVNLPKIEPAELEKLLTEAWLSRASKNLVKEYQKNN